MDFYGDDRKLSELGDSGFSDFLLDKDMFTPSVPSLSTQEDYGLAGMDADWLDTFFEDPVLNDRMITDALQPPHIQSEHSYSLNNDGDAEAPVKQEPMDRDLDDLMPTESTSPLNLTMRNNNEPPKTETIDVVSLVNTVPAFSPTTRVQTVLKQPPTIILATQSAPLTTPVTQDRLVLPKVEVKVEPSEGSLSPEYSPYESLGLPPTPPSSNSSDSEGGLSPQRSAPSSPIRQSQILRHQSIRPLTHHPSSIFSSHIPTSGVLLLTEEEKRTLISEGYPIPAKLPLNKQEEKNLKKIRRKIKNKISAQESRRKKKEYLDTLEKRVEQYSQENGELRKKMDQMENNNRSLLSQLQKLQQIVNKVPRPSAPSTQTSTCLMVLVLCFAMFLGTWSPTTMIGYKQSSIASMATPSSSGSCSNKLPMGPVLKDPTVDAYTTPNIRSRVLMSVHEEGDDFEYGPATPSAYHSLFSQWFQGMKEDQSSLISQIFSPEVPDAQIGNELAEPELHEWNMEGQAAITFTANLTTANIVSLAAHTPQQNTTA